MRTLIAGGHGSLGRDLAEACRERDQDVVALGSDELDVTSGGSCDAAIAEHRPDAVINCAAWTDVDAAESDEAGAMRINDTGAGLLAAAAARGGASVLYVSSDYVFDGSKRSPYLESDLPSALSAYGRSKQAGETATAVANRRHFVVRSSWLFGTGGPNFVEAMLRLGAERPEVLVVSDQRGCPTYNRHLAGALAELCETEAWGIHHIAGGGSASWFEFAEEIFDQAGVDSRVIAATTEMVPRPAPRPRRSVLATERADTCRLAGWRRGLSEYLAERDRAGASAASRAGSSR
ncbi:MAG: dTDP-4-dehydrorhamnose reductase [Solirubrobacterales bacterium]|nr:dTDP-4-dehydrorhamnose reductase [Solirubrobacterales bacterium]